MDNRMTEEEAVELLGSAIVIFDKGDAHRCKLTLVALDSNSEPSIAGGELKCGDESQSEQSCQICVETSTTLEAIAEVVPATLCPKCFDPYEIALFTAKQMRMPEHTTIYPNGVEPV